MDLSEAIQEAYAYADPSITIYETFEISHSSWDSNIYLVDSDVELSTPQGVFKPVMMSVSLPETESNVRGQMKVTFNCLSVVARKALYAASFEDDPIYIQYRQYTGSGADPEAELPASLTVTTVEFGGDFETILSCLYPDLVNIRLGRRIMTTTVLPGGKV